MLVSLITTHVSIDLKAEAEKYIKVCTLCQQRPQKFPTKETNIRAWSTFHFSGSLPMLKQNLRCYSRVLNFSYPKPTLQNLYRSPYWINVTSASALILFSQENGKLILPEAVEYAPYHQLRMLNSAKNLKKKLYCRFYLNIPAWHSISVCSDFCLIYFGRRK